METQKQDKAIIFQQTFNEIKAHTPAYLQRDLAVITMQTDFTDKLSNFIMINRRALNVGSFKILEWLKIIQD